MKEIGIIKAIAMAIFDPDAFKALQQEVQREEGKERLLKTYPIGSSAVGKMLRSDDAKRYDLMAYDAKASIIEGKIVDGSLLVKAQILNSVTNFYDEVIAILDVQDAVITTNLNVAPYKADKIGFVWQLVRRYNPEWHWDLAGVDSDRGAEFKQAFSLSVVKLFHDKNLTFSVVGVSDSLRLIVSCEEINATITKYAKEFNDSFNSFRESFAERKRSDEAILKTGVMVQGNVTTVPKSSGSDVVINVDGVSAYTVTFADERKRFAFRELPEYLVSLHKFTVVDIDEVSLSAYVAPAETYANANDDIQESPASVRAHSANLKSGDVRNVLNGKPLLIDGNNIVRCDSNDGWRVLKTLLAWLTDNSLDYHLYFDASIEHLDMDAREREFISSLLDDAIHTSKCPARDEADKFILFDADRTGGHVLSNDGYRQWEGKYPWLAVKNHDGQARRVHKILVSNGLIRVPDLGIYEKIIDL